MYPEETDEYFQGLGTYALAPEPGLTYVEPDLDVILRKGTNPGGMDYAYRAILVEDHTIHTVECTPVPIPGMMLFPGKTLSLAGGGHMLPDVGVTAPGQEQREIALS